MLHQPCRRSKLLHRPKTLPPIDCIMQNVTNYIFQCHPNNDSNRNMLITIFLTKERKSEITNDSNKCRTYRVPLYRTERDKKNYNKLKMKERNVPINKINIMTQFLLLKVTVNSRCTFLKHYIKRIKIRFHLKKFISLSR